MMEWTMVSGIVAAGVAIAGGIWWFVKVTVVGPFKRELHMLGKKADAHENRDDFRFGELNDRLRDLERSQASQGTEMKNIEEDISEIKDYLKTHINNVSQIPALQQVIQDMAKDIKKIAKDENND